MKPKPSKGQAMTAKRKSDDYLIKVTKKGKTRGRPSKMELHLSAFMTWYLTSRTIIPMASRRDQKGGVEGEY